MLGIDEIKAILKPQFGFMGKSVKAEPLWVHAFNVWSILSKIMRYIPRFNDKERRLLEITTLIHDIGKISDKNQAILSGKISGRVRHTQTREQINAYFTEHSLTDKLYLNTDDIDFIYHAHLHHNLPDKALKTALPALAAYADIVRYADWLASQNRIDRKQIQRIADSLEPFCQMTVVQISRPEGPSNYLLFNTAYKIYKKIGWDALVVQPDGLLLISPKGTLYPDKTSVISNFQDQLIKESILLQKPNPTNFAAVLLAGESAKNPEVYLDVHKDLLLDALGDFDRAPSFFFKLLIEILEISGNLTSNFKTEYPMLDILKGLCGTRGIPIARAKWKQAGGKTFEPLKAMLKEMFGVASLNQIIPAEIIEQNGSLKFLKDISADQLYDILCSVAEKLTPRKKDTELQEELETLISMEEETDFRAIAVKRFKKYKEYKENQRPESGICESCGSTMAFPTQKSLNFPGGKRWGFSQISAHTDSARATCTLCAYDTMMLRKDIPESKNPIYMRIEAKAVDLWALYKETAKLMQRLDAAFYNPYTLEKLTENKSGEFLPLPKEFKIPKLKEPKYIQKPLTCVRGYIIPLRRVDGSASPKDLRAQYMSFYALIHMMGFNGHIGFEEQNGLFGDKPLARYGEDYTTLYYKGLAIKWLAKLLGGEAKEKKNAHIFAETLFAKSPSVAITRIGEAAVNEKKKKKINKDQLSFIFKTIVKGDFIITKNGGDYTMKELLQDAAFFAEGIPAFMWSGDDHKAWNTNSSKHLITKPVSKTLNCILQGDDFETAFAKFLSLIKENISSDKTKKDSIAKVDVKDLKIFVEHGKQILIRYYDERQKNISGFIQAKNALLSSMFLLKRYPNLKEVIND